MPLIDIARQVKAPQVSGVVITTSDSVDSETGLYTLSFTKFSAGLIGTGSMNLGTGSLYAKNIKLSDNRIYASSSHGEELAIELRPSTTGEATGSVRIRGNLVVEGTTSYQNVTTMSIEDPIVDLNFTGSTAQAAADSGLRVGRSGGTNSRFLWDNSATRWTIDNASGSLDPVIGQQTTDTLYNKTITGLASSTMKSAADLTFSGDGEVLGLPGTASVDGAATSKLYVDNKDTYLRKHYIKVVNTITVPSTASFSATTASAPHSMTATSEDDFLFFINGQYMEHDALTIKQAGSNFLLLVNTGSIGYELESDDEVVAWGKFNS